MPYAMKISHQDFHVSKAFISAQAQPGLSRDRAAALGSSRCLGATPPLAWPGRGVSAIGLRGWGSSTGLAEAWGGLRVLRAAFSQVHRGPSSWQGNILLAAESEFEQAQWLEMLQESGKV